MIDVIEPLDTVQDIKLNNLGIRDLLGGSGLISCSFDVDVTMSTQIEFAYVDPNFALTRKVKFKMGSEASFQDYRFQVSRVQINEQNLQPLISISLRSDAVRKLKEAQGKKVMYNVSPTQFIQAELTTLGIKGVLQPSPRRNTIARDVKTKAETKGMDPASADNEMSSWSTFQRFSTETGYMLFENAGTLYFGQAKYLVELDTKPLTAAFGETAFNKATGRKTRVYNVPECTASIDSKISEVSVVLAPNRYKEVQPGQALILAGVPGFAAKYLITSVRYDMIGTNKIEVSAQTPINQVPEEGPFADGSKLI